MSPKQFLKNALVTENKDFEPLGERLSEKRSGRLIHAALGLSSELSELTDMVFTKLEVDTVNLSEESSDLLWYLAIIIDELGMDIDEVFSLVDTLEDLPADKELLKENVSLMSVPVGNIGDVLKKHFIYGKKLDQQEILKNMQDLVSRINFGLNMYGVAIEESMEKNIQKLKIRYGDKFTEAAALERNLEAERAVLEK